MGDGGKTSNANAAKRERIAWVLVVAWAVVIFAMSAKSGADFESGRGIAAIVKRWVAGVLSSVLGRPVDPSPIGHFGEYLILGALLVNALRHRFAGWKAAFGAVAIVAAYAATDEFHQLFVPGRMCDPADWLVDVSAALLVALCYLAWRAHGKRAV